MQNLIIGFLLVIAIIWFLNSFTSAFMMALSREDGKSIAIAFLWGFLVAQIPMMHQMAIYATVAYGIAKQKSKKENGDSE